MQLTLSSPISDSASAALPHNKVHELCLTIPLHFCIPFGNFSLTSISILIVPYFNFFSIVVKDLSRLGRGSSAPFWTYTVYPWAYMSRRFSSLSSNSLLCFKSFFTHCLYVSLNTLSRASLAYTNPIMICS